MCIVEERKCVENKKYSILIKKSGELWGIVVENAYLCTVVSV
jgi:hypothetical protein